MNNIIPAPAHAAFDLEGNVVAGPTKVSWVDGKAHSELVSRLIRMGVTSSIPFLCGGKRYWVLVRAHFAALGQFGEVAEWARAGCHADLEQLQGELVYQTPFLDASSKGIVISKVRVEQTDE